jgi:glycosyltransferase involved in cell wall biosynthesis
METGLKICWATGKNDLIGNAYGYKVHSDTLFKYVSEIAEIDETAKDAVIIASTDLYTKRLNDKVNWLFTMSEGTTLPEKLANNLRMADFWLTPSLWAREVLSQYVNGRDVFVVHHGVEKQFKYFKRKFPVDRPFRFLWVGAPNERKGWGEVATIWEFFKRTPGVELYLKTTGLKTEYETKGNVILDSRNLSKDELIKLYNSAHCFVFPTRAEGFGLVLAEAMATGLPCIATNYSGVTDFFDDTVGYPVGYNLNDIHATFADGSTHITQAAFPIVEEIAEKMVWVYRNYSKAREKGKRASEWIHKNFTWERSARTLVDIIGKTQ